MDLTNLTLTQIIVALFAITAVDFIGGVGTAIAKDTFAARQVAEFVAGHILGRVIPLSFAAAVGVGIPRIGLDPIPAVFAIFLVGAGAYIVETLASIRANLAAPSSLSAASAHANPNPTSPGGAA